MLVVALLLSVRWITQKHKDRSMRMQLREVGSPALPITLAPPHGTAYAACVHTLEVRNMPGEVQGTDGSARPSGRWPPLGNSAARLVCSLFPIPPTLLTPCIRSLQRTPQQHQHSSSPHGQLSGSR